MNPHPLVSIFGLYSYYINLGGVYRQIWGVCLALLFSDLAGKGRGRDLTRFGNSVDGIDHTGVGVGGSFWQLNQDDGYEDEDNSCGLQGVD
jgi:hypothetical protein